MYNAVSLSAVQDSESALSIFSLLWILSPYMPLESAG